MYQIIANKMQEASFFDLKHLIIIIVIEILLDGNTKFAHLQQEQETIL